MCNTHVFFFDFFLRVIFGLKCRFLLHRLYRPGDRFMGGDTNKSNSECLKLHISGANRRHARIRLCAIRSNGMFLGYLFQAAM